MIRSMTGFASSTITITIKKHVKVPISLSLKSLNSRYFDTTCKMPYPLSTYETDFIKIFKQKLHRGYIHFIIHVGSTDVFRGAIEPSLETINGYLNAAQIIKNKFNIQGTLEISDIISLPDVFNSFSQEMDETVKQQIFETTHALVDSLIQMQEAEGKALALDLTERIRLLEKEISTIEPAFNQVLVLQKQKVHDALAEIGMDESKLAEAQRNALYTLLDKLDIHEEIVRFKSHLKALKTEIASKTIEKGKRLDFILQELAREINTITSKCPDATISGHAINIKVELEKAREQAQNIV